MLRIFLLDDEVDLAERIESKLDSRRIIYELDSASCIDEAPLQFDNYHVAIIDGNVSQHYETPTSYEDTKYLGFHFARDKKAIYPHLKIVVYTAYQPQFDGDARNRRFENQPEVVVQPKKGNGINDLIDLLEELARENIRLKKLSDRAERFLEQLPISEQYVIRKAVTIYHELPGGQLEFCNYLYENQNKKYSDFEPWAEGSCRVIATRIFKGLRLGIYNNRNTLRNVIHTYRLHNDLATIE